MRRREPLPPLLSAALEPPETSLEARLARIAGRAHGRARYTVLGEIAEGGMGKILRAWDEALSREVALKIVPREPRKGSSDEERADHERRLVRFIDEARITAQLDHPGIVPVYEIGLDESGAVFFAMPLVRGRDLKSVFALVHGDDEAWTLQRAVTVMHTVCLTVAFAHSRGVIHRDLKPENVMVGPFGEAYVMDWGLALLLGRAERGGIVGTPAYMSPEQAAGRSAEVGPRSDVYSLGAMLYELFARRMPHEYSLEARVDTGKSLEAVLTAPPRPLRELSDDVPAELAAICSKAMAHDQDERYASALDMADDLAAWLDGHVVSALGSGPLTRLRKWRARNRGLAIALDALVVLLLVGSWAFILQERLRVREVQAKSDQALATAYASGLSAADLGLRAHDVGESKRRLAACDGELRGWEWRHLAFRADPSARVFAPEHGAVRALAVTPDGTLVATGHDDGSLLLLDAASGAERAHFEPHARAVTAVAFSPDGTLLASASRDRTARVSDTASGAERIVIREHEVDVLALAFSADGQKLATGDFSGGIALSDVTNGALLERHAPETRDTLVALAFVPGGDELVAAFQSGSVRLFGPQLEARGTARVSKSQLTCLDADPTGHFLAVASERTALLLDAATLTPVRAFEGHASTISDVAFSPDGRRLATCGCDNVVRAWTVADGTCERAYDGHDSDVNAVAFFPDGRRLVTGGEDDTLRLWDLGREPVTIVGGYDGWVDAIAFSDDGHALLTGSHDKTLRLYDARTGALTAQATTPDIVDCVAWNHDDQVAFGCGDTAPRLARATDLGTWTVLQAMESAPRALVFGADGRRLYARGSQGSIAVYDLASRTLLETLDAGDYACGGLALSRDGHRLAAGGKDGEVLTWDADTLAPLARWKSSEPNVTTLAFSPDGGELAVARRNRTIELYSTRTGERLRVLAGHESFASCLAFVPDGSRLISGSNDKTLRVWNPESAEALLTIHGHDEAVTSIAFDASGELLASASKDGTVRLWRTARSFETTSPTAPPPAK